MDQRRAVPPQYLQLGLRSDLLCPSGTDTLAYTSANCATVRQVTAQLIFTRGLNDPARDGCGLELHVYNWQSDPTGAADAVDRLVLGP